MRRDPLARTYLGGMQEVPIPPTRRALCEFCKRELDITEVGTHQWTAGWVKQRDKGGGHAVACPVRSNRWAHSWCVDKASKGLTNQESLL